MTDTVGCTSLCFPKGWSNSPGTSLLSESKGRGVRALGTHMRQELLFSHMCLFSGVLFPSPNSYYYCQTILVSLPRPLNPHKGKKHGARRLPGGMLWELSQAQCCWKGWKMRKTWVSTLALWVLVAELKGSLKPRSPTAQVRVPKVRLQGQQPLKSRATIFLWCITSS